MHLGSDEMFKGPGSCCDERPSHPQDIMGIPKYRMEDWRYRWDELGRCGRVTSPEPIAPRNDRVEYGIRFLDRIDSHRCIGLLPQPQGKGEIGDRLSPQPL